MAEITRTYPNFKRYDHSKSIFNNFPTNRKPVKTLSVDNFSLKTNPQENKKKSNHTALIALGIGCGLLFMSKGVQKYAKKSLEKFRDYLEWKSDVSALKNSKTKTSFYDYSIRRVNSFLGKAESINNINSLKDILFMRAMYKTNPTKKIHKGITKFFEKLSTNTVKKSYKKTQKHFNNMYKSFDFLDDYILKTSGEELVTYKGETFAKKDLVAKAKNCRENVQMAIDVFMMDDTQNVRYNCIKNATSKLYSQFWNESFKDFWTKDNKFKRKEMWQTFIASEQIKDNKTALAETVAYTRKFLSFTDKEKTVYLTEYLKNLNTIIPATDGEGANIMKRLKWFITDPAALKENKDLFLKELKKLEKHNKINDKKLLKDKETNINLIRGMVTDTATGELQDMLDIYYRIAPFELSKSGALKSAQKAVSSFDKSLHLEVGEFFDKARDLELGSAPTDVLTILASCGMITYGLNKAKGSNEKNSVMLKSGIPIIGAIATSLISATKLISGGKSIALGLASGVALNRLGLFIDNYRKTF